MTGLPLEETDKYAWINVLSEETGLGVDTLADLYLRGFIVKAELEIVTHKGVDVDYKKISFWKRF